MDVSYHIFKLYKHLLKKIIFFGNLVMWTSDSLFIIDDENRIFGFNGFGVIDKNQNNVSNRNISYYL